MSAPKPCQTQSSTCASTTALYTLDTLLNLDGGMKPQMVAADNASYSETGEFDPGRLESLAQAVDGLHDVGDARVCMATVIDPPRRFHVYLSEDLAHCVGVWEGRVNKQTLRTAT